MFKRKYWYTPQPDILEQGNTAQTEIIDPEYIAQLLERAGLHSTTAGHTNGAQITTYHFNLSDAKDTIKLNRAIKWLSMALQTPCTIIPSDKAHFAVQVARRDRELVTLR
ncbi:MAG: hypothetical protein BWY15_01150 [Firmicutes bacterium ADurb.Bin193]|nr:MAG: hypothetical protein BWY15_01150 [Firmicutes bacterium ADurb.Bin193]